MAKLVGLERTFILSPLRAWMVKSFEAPLVFNLLTASKESVCLEIGTGIGVGSIELAKRFPVKQIIATDPDAEMVACAKEAIKKSGLSGRIRVIRADALGLPFPSASFDIAFCFNVLHHISDYQNAGREIARVLRPGGQFVCGEIVDHLQRPIVKVFPWVQETVTVTLSVASLVDALHQNGLEVRRLRETIPGLWIRLLAVKETGTYLSR